MCDWNLNPNYKRKPDKQPIGKHTQNKLFTTRRIQLKKDDQFYVFTDGFQDQFGGENGKNFKQSSLKDLFLQSSNMPLESQRKHIDHAFENWAFRMSNWIIVAFIVRI